MKIVINKDRVRTAGHMHTVMEIGMALMIIALILHAVDKVPGMHKIVVFFASIVLGLIAVIFIWLMIGRFCINCTRRFKKPRKPITNQEKDKPPCG
jgi:hypothetical protein